MKTLKINDEIISTAIEDCVEAIDKNSLSINLVIDCQGFGPENESSDALLNFKPFLDEQSIRKIEVISENGETLIYSTKYSVIESANIHSNEEDSTEPKLIISIFANN